MALTAHFIEGRDRELDELLALARDARMQGDRAVLISGEAGIGKTHLVRFLADRLASDGYTVAWGRADPVERAVPYAAISQVLAALPGHHTLRTLYDDAPSGLDAVRNDVYRPVAQLLEAQCAEGPVVVVVDDLHYADEDTLVLIGFLVRRLLDLPIMWALTSRPRLAEPAPGLAALLHRLREDGRLDELVLDRLSAEEITRLVDGAVGRSVDPAAMAVIVERSAGNPFFAIQLALSLAESGVLDRAGPVEASTAVPSISRRVALLERVFPLGENARTVARLASVFGDIDLDQLEDLAAVLGLDVAQVEDGFDRLVRADLLRPLAGSRYEFVHDLVRETLYGDLGPAERRRLHGAAAQVLLQRRAQGETVDLVELAHHLSQGSPDPDGRAVDALREAGDVLVRSAPRSAALRYRQAIEYLPDGGDGSSELHVRLARALHRAGEPSEVIRVCRSGLVGATGDARDRLTRYLSAALADDGDLGGALAIVDKELARRGDSAVLLTTRALLHRLLEDFDEAADDVERAALAARTGPERLAVLFQRINLGVDLGAKGDGGDALAELEALLPALDPETSLMAHAHAAGACAGRGEIRRGSDHLRAADALAAQGVVDVDWPWSFAARVSLYVAEGRWDDAVRAYEEGAPEFGKGLRIIARNHAVAPAGDVALARRDAERLRRLVDDIVDLTPHAGPAKALALSKVERVEGRAEQSRAILEAVLEEVPAGSLMENYLLLGLGTSHLQLGDRAGAAALMDRLRVSSGKIGTPWSDVVLALVELTVCDDADAGQAGLALALEHGNVRYEPDFRLHLGRVGIDADANLTAAHRMYVELGSVDHLAATEAEMRRRGVRVPTRRRADRFALTDAEQRVAALVAEGLSNRLIAERLAYSVKTIEAYLSRIYAKTGCRNRVDLARRFTATPA